MKKIILMCAVIVGFVLNAAAQDNQKAEFKFNEEKHDFGKIPQGTPVTTVFTFTNIGEEPLILTEVRPTCGCTIADYTKTPVKKGDSGKITITYNAAVVAPFNKTIIVTSNAKTPQKYLNIVGEVVAAKAAAQVKALNSNSAIHPGSLVRIKGQTNNETARSNTGPFLLAPSKSPPEGGRL